jgi:hypothetical protein
VILEINCRIGILLVIIYLLSALESFIMVFRDFIFQLRNHLKNGEALKSDILRTRMV